MKLETQLSLKKRKERKKKPLNQNTLMHWISENDATAVACSVVVT